MTTTNTYIINVGLKVTSESGQNLYNLNKKIGVSCFRISMIRTSYIVLPFYTSFLNSLWKIKNIIHDLVFLERVVIIDLNRPKQNIAKQLYKNIEKLDSFYKFRWFLTFNPHFNSLQNLPFKAL